MRQDSEELERLVPYSFRRKAGKLPLSRQRGPRLPNAVLQHGIPARNGEIFNLIFESANSDWDQSATLVTDQTVRLGDRLYKKGVVVHYDSSNVPLRVAVRTREGCFGYGTRGTIAIQLGFCTPCRS